MRLSRHLCVHPLRDNNEPYATPEPLMLRPLPTSLNLLRTFEVAGRHLSFTLAGQELCITTSAVSQQIRALEEQLGVALFERQTRGLALSQVGGRYWQEVQTHLQALERCTRELVRPGAEPPLRVSLMPPVASRVVLPALADFQALHPGVEIRLDASLRQVDLLRQEADLAIRFGTPPWPGCGWERLLEVMVLPVCPPAIAERFQLVGHPENLTKAPLIQMSKRPDSWDQYFALLGMGRPAPDQQQFFVDDYPAAIEAAESLGVALAIMPIEQPLLASGRVVAPLPPLGPLPEAIHAVWRDDVAERMATRAFLTWLKERLAALGKA